MKKCPYCAKDVADDAKLCMHCGKKLAESKFTTGCLIFLLVIIVVFLFGLASYYSGKWTNKISGSPKQTSETGK